MRGMATRFSCNLSGETAPLKHAWEHTVGSDHAPLALRADWQAQLRRCHDELGFRHVRFHGLLSDDMGTLICHGEKLLYSFFNIDRIWDFLLSIGMRPFVELGFMPEALASGDDTVFHYRGNVTPPKDYDECGDSHPQISDPLGRALWYRRSKQMVFRGVERTQPSSVLDRNARRLFQAL
jgi:xylan 1,4-beta-xylosidase